MSELEPPEPIKVSCPDCGEDENIVNATGLLWYCLICSAVFSEKDYGNDYD